MFAQILLFIYLFLWAMQSELAVESSSPQSYMNSQRIGISVTIDFFSMKLAEYFFLPYNRNPWWSSPVRRGPTRPWRCLMGYFLVSLKDKKNDFFFTNLDHWFYKFRQKNWSHNLYWFLIYSLSRKARLFSIFSCIFAYNSWTT